MTLRDLVDSVGREVEGWSYQQLSRPAEELSFARDFQGQQVQFSLEAYESNEQGHLHLCLDARPTSDLGWGPLPSYVFWKRPDGTSYY